jgi:hypothetical protein
MSVLTLTSIDQLGDYTDVKQLISFVYLTMEANAAFGDYERTMNFDNDKLSVTKFDVKEVIVSQNDTSNYIYVSPSGVDYVIAYRKLQDFHRFNIMNIDGMKTLIIYDLYQTKEHKNIF